MLLSMIRSGNINIIEIIVYIISSLMVIFLVMPLHEWAHGFVANKLGDRTARLQGRLTLNPLAHISTIYRFSIRKMPDLSSVSAKDSAFVNYPSHYTIILPFHQDKKGKKITAHRSEQQQKQSVSIF